MNTKNRIAIILVVLLSLLLSSCGEGQVVPTQVPATLPPTQTWTPAPSQTPTITQTRPPTRTPAPTRTTSPVPTLPPGVENKVVVNFIHTTSYNSPAFSFSSHEVNGISHLATHLQNTVDGSRAPVYGLGLEFRSDMKAIGDNYARDHMVSKNHPVYRWNFGEVPEEAMRDVYASEAYVESAKGYANPFTPEFDANISFDKTDFSSADVQTVTITITPRGTVKFANITVHVSPEDGKTRAKILDPLPGEKRSPIGEVISVSPDSQNLFVSELPLKKDQPYTFTFKIQVDPKGRTIEYSPWISLGCGSSTPGFQIESGRAKGNSFEFKMENNGTWVWTAAGEYNWEWHGSGMVAIYNVNFGQYILDK